MKLRHRLFHAGSRVIAATAADRWLASLACGRGLVLAFHHVRPRREQPFAPNRYLEVTPAHLERIIVLARRRGFEAVSLDEIPSRLAEPDRPPFIAFTFDDGYRDNLEHAAPVLSRHKVPWTVFVTAAFAGGHGRLWWLELQEAVARLDRIGGELCGLRSDLPARTNAQKQRAFDALYRHLFAAPQETLHQAVARLAGAAGVGTGGHAGELCLSWDELRALSRVPGVTIGAHTLTHPRLSGLSGSDAAHEIQESRRAIEDRLDTEVRHFAFPYGGEAAAGPREAALARAAGFRTALTTRPDHVRAGCGGGLHALPRVQVSGLFQDDAAIRAVLSGVPFLAFDRLRRAGPRPEHASVGGALSVLFG